MKVTIREKLYDFTSDYPNGWQNSSGDFFKCPVVIGDIKCFIKRIEVKSPRDIPGWDLLLRLKHKNETNLPRIYDIININERGRTVYYIFYEYLQGSSLSHKIAAGIPVDLERLVIEIFNAFESINKYDFWFADFNEKNIFIEDTGRSVLLDLDSAQPMAKSPGKSIYGSKQYWTFIHKYYTDVLTLAESGVLNIPGKVINYLQVVFFALRYKLAQNQPDEYSSPKFLDDLPSSLANIDPAFNEVFNKIYDDGSYSLPSYTSAEIKDLIFQKIIYNKIVSPVSKAVPEIISFKSSAASVGKGESFTLSWQVENANRVEIYKNGVSFKKLSAEISSVSLNEFYDGKDKDVVFSLIASSEYGQSKPKPVIVTITNITRSSSLEPEILSFRASTSSVNKGETFTLDWELNNTTHVDLYKNGNLIKKFPGDNTSFETKEFYDGKDKEVEYSLVVFNDEGQSRQESLKVRIIDKSTLSTNSHEFTNPDELNEPPVSSGKPTIFDGQIITPEPSLEAPVITSFNASTSSVSEGEKFTLEWEVSNVTHLEIYKNGIRFKEVDPATTSLMTTAYYDEKDESLVYVLLAGNEVSEVKSDPVLVDLKPLDVKPIGWLNPKVLKRYLFGALLLVVLIVAAFIFYKNLPGKIQIIEVTPDSITEEHTIVLTGKNLPTDTNNVQVIFNKVPGKIVFSSADIMRVTVPLLAERLGDGNVEVALVFKGDTITAPKKIVVNRDISKTDSIPTVDVGEVAVVDTPQVVTSTFKPKPINKNIEKPIDTVTETTVVQPEISKPTVTEKPINLGEYVKVSSSQFKKRAFGGLKDLTVTVQNDSKYDLDNVKVSVAYKTKNEREIRDKTIDFPNVKAHSSSSIDLPDSRRGRRVSFSIIEISSKQYSADAKN
ncbi:MAG: IPT/TIG domain-containing protein [Chitinophagaceae bacterium]